MSFCSNRAVRALLDTGIEKHIRDEKYPDLNDNERHSIRVIANSLYENIKNELGKSLDLYKLLDEAFVRTTNSPNNDSNNVCKGDEPDE